MSLWVWASLWALAAVVLSAFVLPKAWKEFMYPNGVRRFKRLLFAMHHFRLLAEVFAVFWFVNFITGQELVPMWLIYPTIAFCILCNEICFALMYRRHE